ncbi:MAG: complex I NDUFA9 subunit family protein [Tabrizicola sp.]|uniref:complex I NDUFA9 subunit family protein n=1 Tax=Tabrizicola sp. TaxID=2005166 RepID=UPI0027348550|nr:complex I NDUFA9 subunit family protein [Tabrizicola sp.]MDP3261555.1 complex I NDUFA9 subunit family protein [Tabrizicola sp.]MDP3648376.1 complex I NDUFA9 subunit family protein [Paracoccaceae bacterium]MDZ4065388.1 complex I NDUFA9 subunit family protein [Tabrizicola sp.]
MSKLVTIFGGSGFVGRYIARRMAKEGWRVRVAVRHPNDALFVKPYGTVGQVEPLFCNIRDDASVRRVLHGADAVVNCVGTFDRGGKNNFSAVQAEGAARIARLAAEEGVGRLVHISAIGADAQGPSLYSQSKAEGESAVLAAFPGAVILRPSVIFGTEDQFFNRFAAMSRLGPLLPIAGGETRFQPVYVDDVAQAAVKGVLGQASPGIYELGGPDVDSFAGLMRRMLAVIHRRRLVVSMPFWVMRIVAFVFDMMNAVTLGLIPNKIITRDQLSSLTVDNVVPAGARGFADLGIEPTAMAAVLPEYLWRYRPSGQYAAIKDSAKNLKKA